MGAISERRCARRSRRCRKESTGRRDARLSHAAEGDEAILAPDYVKENAFTLHDGVIAVRTGATLTPLTTLADETARRIRGLIKVRDAVRNTLRTQLEEHSEEAILDARRELNLRYDMFVVAVRSGERQRQSPRLSRRSGLSAALLAGGLQRRDEARREDGDLSRAHHSAGAGSACRRDAEGRARSRAQRDGARGPCRAWRRCSAGRPKSFCRS